MTNLFIGNLPAGISLSELSSFFGDYGTVERVLLGKNHLTGQRQPFCFVDLRERAPRRAAGRLNGVVLRGQTLQAFEATSPSGWALGTH